MSGGTDWWREAASPAELKQNAQQQQTDYWSSLAAGGSGQSVSNPGTTGGPQRTGYSVIDDPKYALPNLVIARASLAPDDNVKIKRLADATGLPEGWFGIKDGEIIRWVPEANAFARVAPSVGGGSGVMDTAGRIPGATASGLGPALPAVAATAAGAAAGPTGASIPIAGATAAVTDLARQGLDKALAGENPVSGLDYLNAAGHGLENAVGQAGGVGINRALTRNPLGVAPYDRLKAMDPAQKAAADALRADAAQEGVDLSTGQTSGLRSIQATERRLGRYDETADQMADFAKRQRETQIPTAFRNKLDQVAPQAGREDQIGAFREGAENVVQGALDQRSAKSAIAYKKAIDDNPQRFWNEDLETLMQRPSVQSGINYAKLIAKEEGRDITVPVFDKGKMVGRDVVPDWRSWDYIKRGIDRVIEENTDQLGRVNAYGRSVVQTKKAMLGILDKENPDYAFARAVHGNGSDAVDAVLEGGAGFLQKMDGADRQNIVERIFAGQNLMADSIREMRHQFVRAGRLDDWNSGLRAFLEGRLENALKPNVVGGEAGNVPGKLYADLWNDRQKAVITAALNDPALVDGFERFMRVARAASRVLPEGSPTATDMTAGGKSAGRKVAELVGAPLSWANLGKEVGDIVDTIRTPAQRTKLADYLLSDAGMDALKNFRMLSPYSQKAIVAASDIATAAGLAAWLNAAGVRSAPDRLPTAEQRQPRP